MPKQLLHARWSKYERHLVFCDGIWFWSSHTAVAVELAGCRCRECDQCSACSSEIWGVWSQLALSTVPDHSPMPTPPQMYSSAPFCVPQLYVLKSRYGTCFEQQYPSNQSTVTKRTVICVYRMTPERSLWEQWYVTDVLLIVLISNWTPLGWSKTLWLI